MAFASFATLKLDEFLQQESAPGELWIFVHIPKTAGSSLVAEWSGIRQPYCNIHADYEAPGKTYDERLENAIDRFVAENEKTSFRACSGHITMRHVRKIRKAIPKSRVVSLLRDPVERVISDYRYARTPAHPPYREFIRQFPTIESYVDSPASQNKMFKFLTPDPMLPAAGLVAFLNESTSFIGLTEMYPMSFNIIMNISGQNRFPTLHMGKTESTEDNSVNRTTGLIKRIREANAQDIALFNFVKERMIARREEWRAHLNASETHAGHAPRHPTGNP